MKADTASLVLDRRSLNLPNAITLSRLILAFVVFALIDLGNSWRTAALLFVVAVLTDVLDGWLARRNNQITVLGRIMDPFVDKIIVCGAFLFLIAHPESGVTAWITLLIIVREMFITSLRSFLEQRGRDFSAQWAGKLKMAVQSATVPVCLLSLSREFREWLSPVLSPGGLDLLRDGLLWGTVIVTLYSGIEYTIRACVLLMEPEPPAPPPGA